jgi:hypothetical protein
MKKISIRNKIPPLSSYLKKNKIDSFSTKKMSEARSYKNSEYTKNASIDYGDLHYNNKFNMIRKISKSSHMEQRLGDLSKFKNNIRSTENIYKDMNFRNVPPFHKNLSEIRRMIKRKKYKNIKLLDVMFFNSGLSNDYFDDFSKFQKKHFQEKAEISKIRPIQRNNSCEELFDVSKKLKNIIKSEETQPLSTNFSKIVNVKKDKSTVSKNKISLKNNISSFTSSTNKTNTKSLATNNKFIEYPSISNKNENLNKDSEMNNQSLNAISLPKINISKSQQIIPESDNQDINIIFNSEKNESQSKKNENTFITDLNTNKVRFIINQLIVENFRGKEKIDKFEEKILKLKIFQSYQKETLEKYLNDDKFNIQDKIDHIIKLFKIYENIYVDYSRDISRYINFLYKCESDFDFELRKINKKRKDLNYELEVIVDKLLTKQKQLEYLINTRNFIFWAKNIGKNIILMNDQYVYRISKRRRFIDQLFDLLGSSTDSLAYKYLKRLIPIEELETIIIRRNNRSRTLTKTRRANTIRKTTTISNRSEKVNKELLYPPTPGEKIFETPDEFIKILNRFQNNNISLLKIFGNSQIEKKNLVKELEIETEIYENYEKTYFYHYITLDEKNLEEAKKRYEILSYTYNYIKNILEDRNNLTTLKKDLRIISLNAVNNINMYKSIKYNKLREKYKYQGLVLLEQLINIINLIFSMNEKMKIFDIQEAYIYASHDILKEILATKKEYFDDSNKNLIKEYAIKLLKIYEFFCQIIINKSKEIKKLNKEKYNKLNEQIQIERKIENTKIIKNLLDERNEAAAKKLKEKWNKKTILARRKMDLFSNAIFEKNKETINEKNQKDNEKEDLSLFL